MALLLVLNLEERAHLARETNGAAALEHFARVMIGHVDIFDLSRVVGEVDAVIAQGLGELLPAMDAESPPILDDLGVSILDQLFFVHEFCFRLCFQL